MLDLVPVCDAAFQRFRHQEVQSLRFVQAFESVIAQALDGKGLIRQLILVVVRPQHIQVEPVLRGLLFGW